jgi:hypothetical protein
VSIWHTPRKGPHPKRLLQHRQRHRLGGRGKRTVERYWGVSNFDVVDMIELWGSPAALMLPTDQVLYNLTQRAMARRGRGCWKRTESGNPDDVVLATSAIELLPGPDQPQCDNAPDSAWRRLLSPRGTR